MKRYIVLAFYRNLGIHCRITDYSSKNDAYEYIRGLRFCDTPYMAKDTKTGAVFDRCNYDMTPEEMAALFIQDHGEVSR